VWCAWVRAARRPGHAWVCGVRGSGQQDAPATPLAPELEGWGVATSI
jgi:hypothetical protein